MNQFDLLESIRQLPDEDAPRLVYADWLEERGERDRAQFIRVQCALASLPAHHPDRTDLENREADLLADFELLWLGEAGDDLLDWRFSRGFVESVGGSVGVIDSAWQALRREHPVRGACIGSLENADPAILRDSQHWAGLQHLTILPSMAAEWGNELLRWPGLRRLRSLALHQPIRRPLREPAFVDTLLRQLVGGPLQRLELHDFSQCPRMAEQLLQSGLAPQLRSLSLRCIQANGNQLPLLLDHADFAGLRELRWSAGRYTDGDSSAWRAFPARQLRRFSLIRCELTPFMLQALEQSPLISGLTQFTWASNRIRDDAAPSPFGLIDRMPQLTALEWSHDGSASADFPRRLPSAMRHLHLHWLPLDGGHWQSWTQLWQPGQLQSLSLVNCTLSREIRQEIWHSPHTRGLRHLALDLSGIDLTGLFRYADGGPQRLRHLELQFSGLSESDPSAIQKWLQGPGAARLAELELLDTSRSDALLRVWGGSETLPSLNRLRLVLNRILPPIVLDWLHSPMLRNLRSVGVLTDALTADMVEALVHQTGLEHLRLLNVDPLFEQPAAVALSGRFGTDVLLGYGDRIPAELRRHAEREI
ncbi:TIGR02996 domain-containing protein [Tuwongella immobilis]|uniref:Repeat-companion domain TIGR02996 n=1 Tax=Tuwongella immobilis TaxID=692036 RepID=A0A6C2YHB0_9BACT|nr:TIGR02996 domain-containing protein [Tuwongella immobilis]VIP00876.1 Repeat-companion domain TIGR02996 OS=Singulisphaera acidiphila (strain ATCC BAA-1392 / DSM 18658 / VKM B-2454 / MOB10) GN=Sinac_4455 PE=4 SV=1 [Tuwongella immobilis]VTR97170.1 Repeat-companion domain TIGR02996 OS=Singulisphaera acidiphila (strain ATCC BAA-1392 / DSM 18658 / VKM B-2454 / MOB10) GN=Sinac_4455 PE=4 SV=1 [Tuwongella immobilis]